MNKEKIIYTILDLRSWSIYHTWTKEDVAGCIGVHRNTIKFIDGKCIIGWYIVFEGKISLKNANMVRDWENNLRKQ